MYKKAVIVLIIVLSSIKSNAERNNTETNNKKTSKIQVCYISPLSTNGIKCFKTRNRYSVNILAGVSQGTDILEIGGLANIDMGHVKGTQIAGYVNMNTKTSDALMIAGMSNINIGISTGNQVAGFLNYSKSINGLQIAGFTNISVKKAVFQLSGFANHSQEVQNGQVSGFINTAKNVKGCQIAGFGNITKSIKGSQVAGFFNVAKKVKGFQVSPFNFCDTISNGVPVGIFSFVRNGYNKVELESNEIFEGNLHAKFGVRRFYNIIGISANTDKEKTWAVSYGVGTIFSLTKKWDMNIDLLGYHISNKDEWIDEANDLYKLKFNFNYNLCNYASLYFGPSLNLLISEITDESGKYIGKDLLRWSHKDDKHDDYHFHYFVGATVGIRLF